ncbi:MAG: hypothetical protein WCO56_19300 [Verrucomicrobiota bacterium]
MMTMDIDGRIFPAGAAPQRRGKTTGEFEFMDGWYATQVKQKDKESRPNIDTFFQDRQNHLTVKEIPEEHLAKKLA